MSSILTSIIIFILAGFSAEEFEKPVIANGVSAEEVLSCKEDIFSILDQCSKEEITFVFTRLTSGKVNGERYDEDLCCLIGMIAQARKVRCSQLIGIRADSNRPAERFFFYIKKGDTPATNPFSALAIFWVAEYLRDSQLE